MPTVKSVPTAQPTGNTVRGLIIVSRDRRDVWETLEREFGQNGEIQIILDRRQGERRKEKRVSAGDRRGVDRRNLPHIEDELRSRQYVLVRPRHRMPRD